MKDLNLSHHKIHRSSMDLLKVEIITKNYPSTIALDKVSLKIGAGEVVGIYGKKKSGKRTLINIILGKIRPDSGIIFFNGFNITNLSARKRQSSGMITMDYEYGYFMNIYHKFYIHKNIREYLLSIIPDFNKRLGRKINNMEKMEIVESTLRYFHSEAHINLGFLEQSAGQSIKVKFASCFMQQPEIIIIDDPFFGFDYHNKHIVFEKMKEYCHNKGISFLFTMDTTETDDLDCDKIYVMESGKIIGEKINKQNISKFETEHPQITLAHFGNKQLDLEITKPVKDFTVFLCFKNTDESGHQTRDSFLANEIYKFFTDRGISVFYSNVSLENLGIAAYQKAINDALDKVDILIAVGTSPTNLDSEWVRFEWSSFYNDILSGMKRQGRLFVYTENIKVGELPRILRQNQVIEHGENSFRTLYNFVAHALGNPG